MERYIDHADVLYTGKAAARKRFCKALMKCADVDEALIEHGLLYLDGNLITSLAEELESAQMSESQEGKLTQATRLLELAESAELFHTSDKDAYATIQICNHRETWPIKSKIFKQWLSREYYQETRTSANSQALQDALGVLEAKALFDGEEKPVHIRIAEFDGSIYLDLTNEAWEAVEITSTGWQVATNPPVRFRRTKGMKPLPLPLAGGSIEELRPFVNLATDEDWTLFCCSLVQYLRPCGPYPISVFNGEQGSAKSTTQRVMRSLIDPNLASLRNTPRDEHDLMIAATNGWVASFDNLSPIRQPTI